MEFTLNIIKDILLVSGVIYGLYEFFLFRKNKTKVEESLDIEIFKFEENKFLLDIKIRVQNKGQIRKYIKEILLSVKSLQESDKNDSIENKKMLRFSNTIIKKYRGKDQGNNILDEFSKERKNLPFWIDAHTTQIFHYPLVVETTDRFAKVSIEYPMGKSGKKYLSKILELPSN